MRPIVWIESPYAGQRDRNVAYARACCDDAIKRGENPFASHLFYTQFLDDDDFVERSLGMSLANEILGTLVTSCSVTVAFYTDLGFSNGMMNRLDACVRLGMKVEMRHLPGYTSSNGSSKDSSAS